MLRRSLMLALLAALAGGCGQSSYSTPSERGARHLRSGDYDQAIAALSEAIEVNPRDVEAHLNRGKAYQYRGLPGDFDHAIDDFSEVIRLAPNDPDAYYNRSMAYRDRGREGDADLAAQDNDAAHSRDPRFSEVYRQIPDTPPPAVRGTPQAGKEVAAEAPGELGAGAESAGDAKRSIIDDVFDRRRQAMEKELEHPTQAAGARPRSKASRDDEMRNLYRRSAASKARRTPRDGEESASPVPSDSTSGADGGLGDAPPLTPPTRPRSAQRGGEGSPASRDRFATEPTLPSVPTSPWQARGGSSRGANGLGGSPSPNQSRYQSPYQSRLPRGPRPTGFVEEPQQAPGSLRPQSRPLYDRPSLPNVREARPSANPDDFNGP